MSKFETRTFGDVTVIQGDCLNVLPSLKDHKATMLFADMPYGTMNAPWDTEIDLQDFWRILRTYFHDALVSLSASNKFMIKLASSNLKDFRYDLIWHKFNSLSGSLNANRCPLRAHENILIFYKKLRVYNPQKTKGHKDYSQNRQTTVRHSKLYGDKKQLPSKNDGTRFPTSVLPIAFAEGARQHPTQKPVALLEWLIATYTNLGDLVLDPTAGSGTTGVAALNLGRRAILIEKDPTYFEVMCKRIAEHRAKINAQA